MNARIRLSVFLRMLLLLVVLVLVTSLTTTISDTEEEEEEETLLTVSRSQLRTILQDFVVAATAREGQDDDDVDDEDIDNLLRKVAETGGDCDGDASFESLVVEQLFGIYNNPDCLDYELDISKINQEEEEDDDDNEVMSEAAKNARRIFQKCRILVLRNVFPTTMTNSASESHEGDGDDDENDDDEQTDIVDLSKFSEFVETAPDDDEGGTTTYGGDFYILKEDVDRFNYMLPQHLVTQSPLIFGNEFIINYVLGHPTILGDDMILNHAGVIHAMPNNDEDNNDGNQRPPRRPQYWHMDGSYVHNEEDTESGGSDDEEEDKYHRRRHAPVVSGHQLPPFAINMFTPVNVDVRRVHGPTDFCLGTSLFRGLTADHMGRLYDHVVAMTSKQQQDSSNISSSNSSSVNENNQLESILRLLQFEWNIHYDHHEGHINTKSIIGNNNGNKNVNCPKGFLRTPLLNRGDVLLFDYMVTHRGGKNVVEDVARQLLFGMYSRPFYRDTTFDGDYSNGSSSDDDDDDDDNDDLDNCEYHEAGFEYDSICELKSLTKMTRFAVLPTITNQTTTTTPIKKKKQQRRLALLEANADEDTTKNDEL